MSAATRPFGQSKWQRRLSVLVATAGMAAASLTLAPAAHARAAQYCENEPELGDYAFVDEHDDLKVFHITSLAEIFVKSDGSFVDNLANSNATTGHFTVTQTKTTTLTTTSSLDVTETASAMGASISTKVGFSQTIQTSVATR